MRHALPVVLFVAFAFLATGTVAQDDLYTPSKEQQQDTSEKGGDDTRTTLPSCVAVTVAPGPVRKDGNKWDLGKSTEAPDIRIVELTTGARGSCEQTWTCSMTLAPVNKVLQFTLTDNDLDSDDEIGEGSCAIGKTCQIELAKVTVKKC